MSELMQSTHELKYSEPNAYQPSVNALKKKEASQPEPQKPVEINNGINFFTQEPVSKNYKTTTRNDLNHLHLNYRKDLN